MGGEVECLSFSTGFMPSSSIFARRWGCTSVGTREALGPDSRDPFVALKADCLEPGVVALVVGVQGRLPQAPTVKQRDYLRPTLNS